jgi:hypothetical protein
MPGAAGHRFFGHPDAAGVLPTLVHGGNAQGPDWFGGAPSGYRPRPPGRERPELVLAEIVAFNAIRDRATLSWITHVADRARSFGYTRFGNGQPS